MAADPYDKKSDRNYWEGPEGSATADDLKRREEGDEQSDSDKEPEHKQSSEATEDGDQEQPSSTPKEEPEKNLYRPNTKQGSMMGALGGGVKKFTGLSLGKKAALFAGIGGALPIVLGIILFFMFIGQLKLIHFGTIMRSAGFAQYQLIMNKAFGQVTFDYATLTEDSAGKLKINGDRFGFTRKRLQELGRDNKLKWDVGKNGEVRSIVIDGERYSFDELSQKLFGKAFKDLGRTERWKVEARMSTEISEPLAEILGNKGLLYRTQVYGGLRKVAHIEMIKWVNSAKDYFGKTPEEARIENMKETQRHVNGGDAEVTGKSEISGDSEETKEAVDEYKKKLDEAAAKGENTGDVKVGETGLQSRIGSSEFKAKLAESAGKASLAVMAITVGCIIHDLAESFRNLETQREVNALRMGHDSMTMMDQTRMGETVTEATSAESTAWGDATTSPYYRQDTGEVLTSADKEAIGNIPSIFPSNTFTKAVETIDDFLTGNWTKQINFSKMTGLPLGWLDSWNKQQNELNREKATLFCTVAMNPIVQGAIVVLDLGIAAFTGGISALVEAAIQGAIWFIAFGAAGERLNKLVDVWTKNISGAEYTGKATGREKYDQARAGTNYFEQIGNRRTAFGAPLTPQQSATNQRVAMQYFRSQEMNDGAFQRYLAVDNPYSVSGAVIARTPTLLVQVRSTVASLLSTTMSTLLNPWRLLPANLLPHAFADDVNANYTITGQTTGVIDFGYTQDEMKIIDDNPDFSLPSLAKLNDEGKFKSVEDKLMRCYEPHLQSELMDQEEDCLDPAYYQPDKGQDPLIVLKWRWYRALRNAEDEGTRDLSSFVGIQQTQDDATTQQQDQAAQTATP